MFRRFFLATVTSCRGMRAAVYPKLIVDRKAWHTQWLGIVGTLALTPISGRSAVDLHKQKEQVGAAAVDYVERLYPDRLKLGIGTGSTAECFIRGLARLKSRIEVTVASSARSEALLKELGIPVVDLNHVESLDVYVDGADEINDNLEMIKGGGAALTREKIVAAASERFVCIADETKLVRTLGAYPVPVEVIPMARSLVARALADLNAQPVWREGVTTDNGNWILDVHGLSVDFPETLEKRIETIPGVVCCGIFAHNAASLALLAVGDEVRRLERTDKPNEHEVAQPAP